eukprot:TRINITY_DN23670_c0_g2_i1.p1 TRINITY_DN23670_c0_g2~~TRINITY_DN23670_c0_g2_i1.p1  ORF type:complete len:254 (+),score=66.96 TRINITY_DN23670_c0_g2_i1:56-817(+)
MALQLCHRLCRPAARAAGLILGHPTRLLQIPRARSYAAVEGAAKFRGRRALSSEAGCRTFVCPACGSASSTFSFSCRNCGKLMDASYGSTSHYEILGLETRFQVDGAEVDSAYKDLQRLLHPDRHAQSSEEQLAFAEAHSARLNEAVAVLRSPLRRASYWMELHGASVLEEDQRIEDAKTMMEVMETSEELEEAQSRAEVDEISDSNSSKMREVEAQLADTLASEDWAEARRLVERLQMLTRLQQRLDDWRPP